LGCFHGLKSVSREIFRHQEVAAAVTSLSAAGQNTLFSVAKGEKDFYYISIFGKSQEIL